MVIRFTSSRASPPPAESMSATTGGRFSTGTMARQARQPATARSGRSSGARNSWYSLSSAPIHNATVTSTRASMAESLRTGAVPVGRTGLLLGKEMRVVHSGRIQRTVVLVERLVPPARNRLDGLHDRIPAADIDAV